MFKVLPQCSLFSNRPLTVHENIVLQTTAVATGTLPLAAGLVGVRQRGAAPTDLLAELDAD